MTLTDLKARYPQGAGLLPFAIYIDPEYFQTIFWFCHLYRNAKGQE